MNISHQILEANALLIKLVGRLDADSSPTVKARLHEYIKDDYQKIIVDLAQVPFIDSSGLASLVSALRVAREKGGNITLCGIQAQAQIIFRLTMLDRVFAIYPTLAEAQQNLS